MGRLARFAWIIVAAVANQSLAQGPASTAAKPEPVLVGKTSVDLIRLDGTSPSVPLRNAGVIGGSERIEIDGRALVKGTDYTIDYPSGTIYVMRGIRAGQSLRASYRFDASQKPGTAVANHWSGFKMDMQGGNSVMLGLGMAERGADGTVATNNIYGFKNNFGFAGAGLSGMVVIGERKRVKSYNLLESGKATESGEDSKGQAIVQNLGIGFMGGKIEAGLQDISQKFNGFSSFGAQGYSDQRISELQKERGLKRVSFGLREIGGSGAGTGLSQSYRSVKDGDAAVDWRSLGFKSKGASLEWSSQKIDKNFKRFGDLTEGDRGQLAKEAGMSRELISGALGIRGGGISFNSLRVEEETGGVYRRNLGLDSKQFKFNFSDQRVEKGFTKFGSLREADAGQLAREVGLRRQSISMDYAPGLADLAIGFRQSWLRTDESDSDQFKSQDLSIGTKKWNFERMFRGTDAGMAQLGALTDTEINGHMGRIGRFVAPEGVGPNGNDRNAFLGSAGVSRTGTRFGFDAGRGTNFAASQYSVKGAKDNGQILTLGLTGTKFKINYRDQSFGENLTEASTLMEFERARFGNLSGVKKTDLSTDLQLGGAKKFAFSTMNAGRVAEGKATRQSLAYQDKGIDLQVTERKVDAGFETVNQLVDPEKDLLGQLRGFKQRDVALRANPYRGLTVNLRQMDSNGLESEAKRFYRESLLGYEADTKTKIEIAQLRHRYAEDGKLKFENNIDRWFVSRDFGKLGRLSLTSERISFDGTDAKAPDSNRFTYAFETNLTAKTAVRTEQTKTTFDTGEQEKVSSNTLSTEISSRTGVSVTETKIDRDGDKPDEASRSYGFWWDFGRGLRLNYGYARQLNSTANGTMQTNFSLTPGQVGGIAVGALTYQDQRWDNQRYAGVGNVQLSTLKPLDWGFLKDVQFRFGADTQRDNWQFQRENRGMGFAARAGKIGLAWEYNSQMAPASRERAVDRVFRLTTAQDENAKFRADVTYKLRTMPNNQQFMIRNYKFSAKPMKDFEISHQMVTNPEVQRPDLLLGTLPQAARTNNWRLDYNGNRSTKLGMSWEERLNDQTHELSRTGMIHATLFANNPSPLTLSYGLEQSAPGGKRRTAHRYSLQYDQRPGPNQLFSFTLGNTNWQHSRGDKEGVQNWTLRTEFQLRF